MTEKKDLLDVKTTDITSKEELRAYLKELEAHGEVTIKIIDGEEVIEMTEKGRQRWRRVTGRDADVA